VIAFAAIAPHGDPAFVDGSPTRLALEEAGRRLEAAEPETTIVLTPHNVHVEGAFGVVVAATLAGRLDELEPSLAVETDRELAGRMLAALREAGLPATALSFGSNDPALAEHPLDWGAHIPLELLGRDTRPVVVVSPARELSLADHVRAGAAIADACAGRRVAVIASADHGHAPAADGPFGFHPAAREYDGRVVELVRANRLAAVVELEPIVEDAKADSLWQLAMLHGALGDGFEVELLSYEAPTYFGMLVAAFRPTMIAPSSSGRPTSASPRTARRP
jgi:aromatic ring-opening dioxygenase LigB subunit